jgi:polyisoprenoid-binding protein YceI
MSDVMDESTTTATNRLRRLPLLIGLGVVGLIVVGIGLYVLLRGDAPAAVDLDAATAELAGEDDGADEGAADDADASTDDAGADDGATGDDTTDDAAATISDVSGDWTVDTSIGEFSFENSTGTYVGFRVGEELTTVGVTEAVGRTPAVTGTVSIDGQTVTAVNIEADMSAITTDISRRDGAARRALGTDEFPTASFVLTEPIDLGVDPATGDPISVTATGDMTIRGVTNPVEVQIDAQLVGDTIAIVGTTDVVFADYGVSTPSAPVVVRLDDFGVIEFQLFLTQS